MGKQGQIPVAEYEKRVEIVRKLLAVHTPKSTIKRVCCQQFDVSSRTVETYISRARNILLEESKKPRDEHKSESYSMYASIVADKNASYRDRIMAQRQIDKLYGLHDPLKVAQTDRDGNDLPLTDEQRRQHIAAILADANNGE